MNYKLSTELYGNNVWMIDPLTFNSMWEILKDMRNGIKYEHDGEKLNSFGCYDISNAKLVRSTDELFNFSNDAELVNIINLNGVITKNGGPSTNGTKQLANQIRKMDADNRVKGHLIVASSGGGAGNAIKTLTNAIKSTKKPIGTFIEQGEMACSACYGIISASDFIMAEDNDVIVGSLGTMISLSGRPKSSKDEKGQLHVRLYATKSTQKNDYYEQAMEGNGKPMIEHILDPANEIFLNAIKENRPSVDEKTQMNGSIFKANEVLGTMVDSIGSFNDAINKLLQSPTKGTQKPKNGTNSNINTNNKQMTKAELQNAHPEVYNAILNEGIMSERDRSGAWLAHCKTDMDAVIAGVKSGEKLTETQIQEFLVQQNSLNRVNDLTEDSAEDVTTPQSQSLDDVKKEELKNEEVEAFNFDLK
tara:strand:+ start:322 stop:1578 length:1257 start_codon:yes stop_codon:yes gene_type:complete